MWRKKAIRFVLYLLCAWVLSVVFLVFIIIPRSFDDTPVSEKLFIRHALKPKVTSQAANNLFRHAQGQMRNKNNIRRSPKSKFINIKQNEQSRDSGAHARELRLHKEEAEKKYYTQRTAKIHTLDTKFIISNAHLCDNAIPYLLVIVPSLHRHIDVRRAIRATYGSYVNSKLPELYNASIDVTMKLVFLFGRDSHYNYTDPLLVEEQRQFGDIVQANFYESYKNLTRKILIGLKWASVYCAEMEHVLKVDEDVFVNIPNLIHELVRHPYSMKGSVYGYLNQGARVRRKGKWSVSIEEFPLTGYPTYASGNSYVLSGNIVSRLVVVSQYFPYMPIEDAFITGVLAKAIHANHTHFPGFTFWLEKAPLPCTFIRDKRISANKVTLGLIHRLWLAQQQYDELCKLHT